MKIAIVVSRFNSEVTERLLMGAVERLTELEIEKEYYDIVKVPGAVEIPLAAQQFARDENYAAVICLGAVIRGETDHYEYVCRQVSEGCQRISLQFNIPVIFGVLTTENEEQALARAGGEHGNKGSDAVDAAFEMIKLMDQLCNQHQHEHEHEHQHECDLC